MKLNSEVPARQQFGKLTDDDFEMIAGQRDKLVGKLQERYGYAREEAQKRADEWLASTKGDQGKGHEQGQSGHSMPPPQPTHGSGQQTQKR